MLIRETARAIAGHRWIEERLFELTGSWAGEGGDAEVTRLLATQSRHHGWRAAQWEALVPALHDLDPSELEAPAADVALLDGLTAEEHRTVRLAGLTRVVLPEVLRRYDAHGASATEVADAPVARMLRLVVLDARSDQQAAEQLLRTCLVSEDLVARATTHQSELGRLLS